MNIKILALDPATKCGWAVSPLLSGVWDLSIRRDESKGMRLLRLKAKLSEVCKAENIELIAFEAVRAAGGHAGALVVQSELQGVIKLYCEEHGIEFVGYSSTEIKKHATGKGNASKDSMVEAAKLDHPGIEIIDDNHADALHILSLASNLFHDEPSHPTTETL